MGSVSRLKPKLWPRRPPALAPLLRGSLCCGFWTQFGDAALVCRRLRTLRPRAFGAARCFYAAAFLRERSRRSRCWTGGASALAPRGPSGEVGPLRRSHAAGLMRVSVERRVLAVQPALKGESGSSWAPGQSALPGCRQMRPQAGAGSLCSALVNPGDGTLLPAPGLTRVAQTRPERRLKAALVAQAGKSGRVPAAPDRAGFSLGFVF